MIIFSSTLLLPLFMQTQVVTVPISEPPVIQYPIFVTAPIYSVKCELINSEMKRNLLNFKLTGGRGYIVEHENDPVQRFRATPQKIEVTLDEAGVFEGDWFIVNYGDIFMDIKNIETRTEKYGNIQMSFLKADVNELAVSVMSDALYVNFVGFCSFSTTPQTPLSFEETTKFLAK